VNGKASDETEVKGDTLQAALARSTTEVSASDLTKRGIERVRVLNESRFLQLVDEISRGRQPPVPERREAELPPVPRLRRGIIRRKTAPSRPPNAETEHALQEKQRNLLREMFR